MTINTKKIQNFDLLTILAVLVLVRISCPALSNIPFMSMTFVFVYGVTFLLLYIVTTSIKKEDLYLIMAAMGYTLYVFLRNFIAGNGLFARDSFNAYIIVFLTVIYIWVKGQDEKKQAMLLKLIFFTCIFNYIYSIRVLYFDPDASRMAASSKIVEASPYDFLKAIGSFDAVYGGISVILIFLYMRRIFKEKEIKNRITVFILILALVFVVMASYATAVVLLVFALMVFAGSKSKVWSLVFLLVLVAIMAFHGQIGELIIDASKKISFSETLGEKLYDFGHMFKGFELMGTYEGDEGRFARLFWSIEAFEKYPIFGSIGRSGAMIGGHSEFFDLLGRFGIVGMLLVCTYLYTLYKHVMSYLESEHMRKCMRIVMLVFAISSVLNPSLYALQMVPIILMIPLAPAYVKMMNKKSADKA